MTRNDIQVIIHSAKDRDGKQHFTAEWIADNVGPSLSDTGIRGQHFHTDLDKEGIQPLLTQSCLIEIAVLMNNIKRQYKTINNA